MTVDSEFSEKIASCIRNEDYEVTHKDLFLSDGPEGDITIVFPKKSHRIIIEFGTIDKKTTVFLRNFLFFKKKIHVNIDYDVLVKLDEVAKNHLRPLAWEYKLERDAKVHKLNKAF